MNVWGNRYVNYPVTSITLHAINTYNHYVSITILKMQNEATYQTALNVIYTYEVLIIYIYLPSEKQNNGAKS